MGRLVILAGPSCIGKGPLHAALKRLYPQLAAGLRQVVLYNDRSPRPGEQDLPLAPHALAGSAQCLGLALVEDARDDVLFDRTLSHLESAIACQMHLFRLYSREDARKVIAVIGVQA